MEESNWSDLSNDLLTLIVDKLIFSKDYIRFGATCITWRNVFVNNRDRLPQQPPMLMFLDHLQKQHRAYSLSDKKVYDLLVPIPHYLHCRCSSFGWVFTVEDESLAVRLINPFLSINNEIHLPSLKSLDENLIPNKLQKVVLSANPYLTPDYVVLVIYGVTHKLGFVKSGDKTWTSIGWKSHGYEDAIYYKDEFYVIHYTGKVEVCDFNSPQPKLKEFTPSLQRESCYHKKYIVESSGELLKVTRRMTYIMATCTSLEFKVFKLDPLEKKWLNVKGLRGRALFLGNNSSMSVSASDFPGYKPNCIYFTDTKAFRIPRRTMFVTQYIIRAFNLEDGSFEQLYLSPKMMTPSIWVEPTVQVGFN